MYAINVQKNKPLKNSIRAEPKVVKQNAKFSKVVTFRIQSQALSPKMVTKSMEWFA